MSGMADGSRSGKQFVNAPGQIKPRQAARSQSQWLWASSSSNARENFRISRRSPMQRVDGVQSVARNETFADSGCNQHPRFRRWNGFTSARLNRTNNGQTWPMSHGSSERQQIQTGARSIALSRNELIFGVVQPTPSKTTVFPFSARIFSSRFFRCTSGDGGADEFNSLSRLPRFHPKL